MANRIYTDWRDAGDLDELTEGAATAYGKHIQPFMAARAESVVQKWLGVYECELEHNPRKLRARNYDAKRDRERSKKRIAKPVVTEKECIKCHVVKPIQEYYEYRNVCRICYGIQQRENAVKRKERK